MAADSFASRLVQALGRTSRAFTPLAREPFRPPHVSEVGPACRAGLDPKGRLRRMKKLLLVALALLVLTCAARAWTP